MSRFLQRNCLLLMLGIVNCHFCRTQTLAVSKKTRNFWYWFAERRFCWTRLSWPHFCCPSAQMILLKFFPTIRKYFFFSLLHPKIISFCLMQKKIQSNFLKSIFLCVELSTCFFSNLMILKSFGSIIWWLLIPLSLMQLSSLTADCEMLCNERASSRKNHWSRFL